MREEQQRAKQPTGYDRLCLGLTREERAGMPGFSPEPVVRMLVPEDVELEFDDLIMGRTRAPRPDDQVILKADGFPTYHLAVVVDDHEMGITHVVRGQEWISSTPKHLLLYRWLGLTPPKFAHMPLLRDEKKAKISKRKNPWARLTWFKEQGYLPEALVNFLALQGYPPIVEADGTEREVFSFAEFTERFRWEDVNRAGAIFNLDKLDWLNGVYIRGLDGRDFTSRLLPYLEADGVLSGSPSLGELGRLMAVAELIQTRIGKLLRGHATGPAVLRRRRPDRDRGRRPRAAERRLGGRARRRPAGPGRHRRPPARAARVGERVVRRGDRGRSARGGRGRAGDQAQVRVRAAADRRVGPAGVAAAVRVDGDPGQDVDAGPDPCAARHALIWGRVRRTGNIAPRSRRWPSPVTASKAIPPWGMV